MDSPRRIRSALRRLRGAWFANATHRDFLAARTVVGFNALWLVLSRPDLPDMTAIPAVFWKHVLPTQRVRFLAFAFPPAVEQALYAILVAALVLFLLGRWTWICGWIAAALLYRFGALEPLVGSTGLLWFQGFTHPIVGLAVIAAASGRGRTAQEDRWSVGALRALFALYYFLCGYEKLAVIGPRWISVENIRSLLVVQQERGVFHTPLAPALAASPTACGIIAVTTIVVELLFPLVLVSTVARRVLVPLAVIGHVGIALALGLVFPNWPFLLLYVDWARKRRTQTKAATASTDAVPPAPDSVMGPIV